MASRVHGDVFVRELYITRTEKWGVGTRVGRVYDLVWRHF